MAISNRDSIAGERPDARAAPWEAVLEQLPTAAIVAEVPGGRTILANRRVERVFRRPFLAAPDVSGYAAWCGFHRDGRPYRAEEWPLARSVLRGEIVEGEEVEIERGDGTRGIVLVSARPIRDASGAITAAVTTLHDVTAQKIDESGRRFLIEAGTVFSSSLNSQTTLRNLARLAVPTLADWCSVDLLAEDGRIDRIAVQHRDPERAATAAELARRFPPDPHAATGVAEVLRTGEPLLLRDVGDDVLREVASSEEQLHFLRTLGFRSAMIVPLIARGRTLGCISLISAESGRRYDAADLDLARELAQRGALAIDNARLYDESQAANRAKSDFLAVISHELRTPLTAVIGYSELLELGIPEPLTDRQREQVERIELAARHLLTLIEEILTLSSLESGHSKVSRETVSIAELLHRADVISRPLAEAKDLRLEVSEVPPDLAVVSDPDKLLQVLLNLLSNAVKFTRRGAVRMEARPVEGAVEIAVRDTGVGIDAADHERIFEPFWQVEQPITRREGGTGLGLSVTRRLLELLGGDVRVESARGEGSTFTARVPLRPPEAAGDTRPDP
ncbi:MAG TPA: ATP-binding protein [Longimicrobiaceae bacterium]|nr:ATP-binding protein [Longimicrobiaceae bacterium]